MNCKFCGKECKNDNSLRNHERLCPNNPDRIYVSHTLGKIPWNKGLTKENDERINKASKLYKNKIKEGKIIPSQLGKPLSEDHKKAISIGMKKAHNEKRAHNIGESRWNNEHSYPEKWFINMLHNEFYMEEHEHYQTEYPFDRFSLDFAWVSKKLCIEIDGEQHEKLEYKERDDRKDKLLKDNGWEIIRIKWKDCFNNPKTYIEMVRNKFKDLNLI